MKLNRVGDSDLQVSRIGLGTNNFGTFGPVKNVDRDRARQIVETAIEHGITLFDTAETYAEGVSETWLGEFLEPYREQVVISTKFDAGDAAYIRKACEQSLTRLRTDYIDLFYYHFPDTTPIMETLLALQKLVDEGKVREIGCSNFSVEQLADADAVAQTLGSKRFVAIQNEYHLLERRDETAIFPLCREHKIGYIPFSPLANGVLTGKYSRDNPPPTDSRAAIFAKHYGTDLLTDDVFDQLDAFTAFAEEHGRTLRELAIAAVASRPEIPSVTCGASSPEHVIANVKAGEWELAAEDVAALPFVEGLGLDPLSLHCMCEEPRPWSRIENGEPVYYCAKCHVRIESHVVAP